jgi:hypothetical protein
VWNFGRGDGVEKALMFANFLYNEMKTDTLNLSVERSRVILEANGTRYLFISSKDLVKQVNLMHLGDSLTAS